MTDKLHRLAALERAFQRVAVNPLERKPVVFTAFKLARCVDLDSDFARGRRLNDNWELFAETRVLSSLLRSGDISPRALSLRNCDLGGAIFPSAVARVRGRPVAVYRSWLLRQSEQRRARDEECDRYDFPHLVSPR
jgi:hypothetical protein